MNDDSQLPEECVFPDDIEINDLCWESHCTKHGGNLPCVCEKDDEAKDGW